MILKKRGVGIYTGARDKRVLQQDGGLVCQFEDKAGPRQVECDGVLISVGRRANTEGLLAPGLDLQIERGANPRKRAL